MCPLKERGHRKVSSACFARHLSKFHKLSKQERQRIQFINKARKTYTWKAERPAAKYKDYHVQRKCPVHKCGAAMKRLKPHLTGKFHNITDFFHIFADDIRSKDVTIEDVRRKSTNHPLLADIPAKTIIDKVREFSKRDEATLLTEIPEEKLQEKVERMFHIEEASQSQATEVATISNTTSKQGIFSEQQAQQFRNLCSHIINDSRVHTSRIQEAFIRQASCQYLLETLN